MYNKKFLTSSALVATGLLAAFAVGGARQDGVIWYVVGAFLLLTLVAGATVTSMLLGDLGRARQRIAGLETELAAALESARAGATASSDLLHLLGREVRSALSTIIGFAQIIEYSNSRTYTAGRHAHKIAMAGHDLMYVVESVTGTPPREPEPEPEIEAGELAGLLSNCGTNAGPVPIVERKSGQGVLVVEDDEFNQEVIREQIGMIGLRVDAVSSAYEALALAQIFRDRDRHQYA